LVAMESSEAAVAAAVRTRAEVGRKPCVSDQTGLGRVTGAHRQEKRTPIWSTPQIAGGLPGRLAAHLSCGSAADVLAMTGGFGATIAVTHETALSSKRNRNPA
jgi:hypothetical protein